MEGKTMAASVNKVILIGNLGRQPEVRFMPDGTKVVNFSLATHENWKDKQTGERREKTEWHRIVIMNDHIANIAEQYLKKGSKIYLEGQLQTRKWLDQRGQEKYTTEIILTRYRGELVLLDTKESVITDNSGIEPSYLNESDVSLAEEEAPLSRNAEESAEPVEAEEPPF